MDMEKVLLFGIAALFIVAAVQMMDSPAPESEGTGGPAPDFSLPALRREQPWQLSDMSGQVVVLSFWASWCGPCRREMPGLQDIHERFADQDVVVLAVNEGEDEQTVRQFIDAEGYTFPVALDTSQTVGQNYGVRGIPRLFILDPAGTIAYDQAGYRRGQEEHVIEVVESLLAEKSTS